MILLLTAVKEVELGCKVACRYATTAVRLKRLKKPNLWEVYAGGDQLICRDGVELDFMTCCLIYITHKRIVHEITPCIPLKLKILTVAQEIRKHMRRVFGGNQRQHD